MNRRRTSDSDQWLTANSQQWLLLSTGGVDTNDAATLLAFGSTRGNSEIAYARKKLSWKGVAAPLQLATFNSQGLAASRDVHAQTTSPLFQRQ